MATVLINMVEGLELLFGEFDIAVEFGGIGKVSHPSFVREDGHISLVFLHHTGISVHMYLVKLYLPHHVLVVISHFLPY